MTRAREVVAHIVNYNNMFGDFITSQEFHHIVVCESLFGLAWSFPSTPFDNHEKKWLCPQPGSCIDPTLCWNSVSVFSWVRADDRPRPAPSLIS
jgi:hypothetical protein